MSHRSLVRAAPRRRPRRRSHPVGLGLVMIALVLVATSCIWSSPRGTARSLGFQPAFEIHPDNMGHLVEEWRAAIGPSPHTPVVDGRVAVVAGGTTLRAFSAPSCGTPTCQPIWQASTPAPGFGQPVIDGSIVYVVVNGALQAYDVNGARGCGGMPVVCTPLWTGTTGGALHVTAGDGVVVTTDLRTASVYPPGDGATCAGTPKACVPLRLLDFGCSGLVFCGTDPASIGDGMIVIGTESGDEFTHGGALFVFDLDGSACAPAPPGPPVCSPQRNPRFGGINGAPAVHDGLVTVQYTLWHFNDQIFEYQPQIHGLRTYDPSTDTMTMAWDTSSHEDGDLAVFGGFIYELDANILRAHDAADGSIRWSATLAARGTGLSGGGGVLYVATETGEVQTFDATGFAGCSGTPTVCTSLGSLPSAPTAIAALSNGRLWLAGADGILRVLRKPAS